MKLVRPSAKYEKSFKQAVQEFKDAKFDSHYHDAFANLQNIGFDEFVKNEVEKSKGKHLQKGYVPETVFWLVEGNEYIGRISVRHELNDNLLRIGGHIGYEIRPSRRGQGYGTAILAKVLTKVRRLGIKRVLLTCDATNIISRRIIERAGGVLENEVSNASGPNKLRFWIDITR
ncbi:MAG: GNAT family N-acetyltransferase [bacterium]|nr:GNAT family N-acetyltransferase [bacterium]